MPCKKFNYPGITSCEYKPCGKALEDEVMGRRGREVVIEEVNPQSSKAINM